MSALSKYAQALPAGGVAPSVIDELILARIACSGGTTRAQLVRDLGPLLAPKLSTTQWKTAADTALARLMMSAKICGARGRLRLTEQGEAVVSGYFGEKEAHARTWSDQRDVRLVAKALGVDASKPALRMALARPDGLSALVVQHAFGLSMRQALSPSKLRAALALVALERAFGDNVKEGLGNGSALSAKAGRVLAGQLLQKPRELPTDTRLISCAVRRSGRRCALRPRHAAFIRAAQACKLRGAKHSTIQHQASLAGGARIGTASAEDPHTTTGRDAAAPWTGAIFRRCAERGTHPRRGLARGTQGVYLSGVGRDSQFAPRVGTFRDRLQGHAGRRSPGGSAGALRRRSQEQTKHQGVRGFRDPLQEHRLALRARRRLRRRGPSTNAA